MSEPKPYAVCLVAEGSGEDLISFETFDVPSFGDVVRLALGPHDELETYEVVRVERHAVRAQNGHARLRAIVSLAKRDGGHQSPQERDRASMADAASTARELLGYGTFDLGQMVCRLLQDRREALAKLRSLVPAEEHTGVADLLAEYLDTKGRLER
jgi:hypothetical protein